MKTTKFKPSAVGPIPEEWEVKRLGEIADFATATVAKDSIDLRWYIGTENMLADKAGVLQNTTTVPYKTVREYKSGDVLISNIRPYLHKIWLADCDGGCSTDVLVIRTHNEAVCSHKFLAMLLSDDAFFDFVMANAVGTKMPRGDKKVIVNFEVKIPPRPEQEKIAEALSDVDALLAAMTTLIEKKQAIKQGAMQQLLTGKKRLAGFSGKWVEKRLGECGDFIGGGTPSTSVSSYWGGNVDWYTPAEIGGSKYVSCSERRISNDGLRNSAARILPVGTILLTTRASIGLRAILRREAATNQGFQSLLVNESNDSEFMYYFLSTVVGEMECRASGSTFLEISSSKLKEIPIVIPPTLAEQKAIAAVLSDMDAEIAALEAKRAKYESIKQGMMQELLTGRVRLVGRPDGAGLRNRGD